MEKGLMTRLTALLKKAALGFMLATLAAFATPTAQAMKITKLPALFNPKRLKAPPQTALFPWMRRGIEEARDGQKKQRKDNPHEGGYSISFPTGSGGLQTFSFFEPLAEGKAAMSFTNKNGVDVTWIGLETKKHGVNKTSRWRKEGDKVTHFFATDGKRSHSIAKKSAFGGTLHFFIQKQSGKGQSARFSLLGRTDEEDIVAFHDTGGRPTSFFRQKIAGPGVSGWLHLQAMTFAEALATPVESWRPLKADRDGRILAESVDVAWGNLHSASQQISGVEEKE